MKKSFFLLIALLAVIFISCESKEEPKVFKLDPNATINLKPDMAGWKEAQKVSSDNGIEIEYYRLSPLEIVKQTVMLAFYNDEIEAGEELRRGFSDNQKDTISNPPMLKMWGTDIIDQDGNYISGFINGWDFILLTENRDTLGYIPNTVIINARDKIKAAYDAKNNEEVYRLFNEVFTFLPITGAEYRALKAEGKN